MGKGHEGFKGPSLVPDEINKERGRRDEAPDTQIAPKEVFGVYPETKEEGLSPIEGREYNFKEMAEIEPAMVSLVEQLKENIEKGEYSALLSDDAGGRIPTLVLDKIFREKSPEKTKTYFLASGKFYFPIKEEDEENYKEMTSYLKKINFGNKKLLITTEYTFNGGTLRKIGEVLQDIKISNFDFAFMHYDDAYTLYKLKKRFKDSFNSDIFSGSQASSHIFAEKHEKLSGVRKTKNYSPTPEKSMDQDSIKKSREDVKLMAERIIGKIWPEIK